MLTKRTNILFDEQSWKKLTSLARGRGISVGELVRTAVQKEYSDDIRRAQLEETVQAIHRFRETHGKALGKGEDSTKIIRRMRDTRYGRQDY